MKKIIIASAVILLPIIASAQNSVKTGNQSPVQNGDNNTVNYNGFSAADVAKIVTEAIRASKEREKADAEIIKSLTAAVTALAQGKTNATPSQVDAAFAALRKGDFSLALSLFETEAERFEKEAKKGAGIQRNIGALAFLGDTQKSLKAYRRATQLDPDNTDGWNQLGLLLKRVGKLDEAINAYQTVLRLGQEHKNQKEIAIAYGNLGNVYQTRGDLDKAIEYYNKSLKINESLGHKEGMANDYGNLGIVYQTRGALDKAVEYHNKALQINQSLGHREGMANDYGNLGILYQKHGELDKAVEYHNKALQINESLGRKEGMAANYSNLGNVYRTRGDLDKAKEYYNKALQINENLGREEGMAINYDNLGIVYKMRGYLDKAREYYNKALQINQSLGRKDGMAGDGIHNHNPASYGTISTNINKD